MTIFDPITKPAGTTNLILPFTNTERQLFERVLENECAGSPGGDLYLRVYAIDPNTMSERERAILVCALGRQTAKVAGLQYQKLSALFAMTALFGQIMDPKTQTQTWCWHVLDPTGTLVYALF